MSERFDYVLYLTPCRACAVMMLKSNLPVLSGCREIIAPLHTHCAGKHGIVLGYFETSTRSIIKPWQAWASTASALFYAAACMIQQSAADQI